MEPHRYQSPIARLRNRLAQALLREPAIILLERDGQDQSDLPARPSQSAPLLHGADARP